MLRPSGLVFGVFSIAEYRIPAERQEKNLCPTNTKESR